MEDINAKFEREFAEWRRKKQKMKYKRGREEMKEIMEDILKCLREIMGSKKSEEVEKEATGDQPLKVPLCLDAPAKPKAKEDQNSQMNQVREEKSEEDRPELKKPPVKGACIDFFAFKNSLEEKTKSKVIKISEPMKSIQVSCLTTSKKANQKSEEKIVSFTITSNHPKGISFLPNAEIARRETGSVASMGMRHFGHAIKARVGDISFGDKRDQQ